MATIALFYRLVCLQVPDSVIDSGRAKRRRHREAARWDSGDAPGTLTVWSGNSLLTTTIDNYGVVAIIGGRVRMRLITDLGAI